MRYRKGAMQWGLAVRTLRESIPGMSVSDRETIKSEDSKGDSALFYKRRRIVRSIFSSGSVHVGKWYRLASVTQWRTINPAALSLPDDTVSATNAHI